MRYLVAFAVLCYSCNTQEMSKSAPKSGFVKNTQHGNSNPSESKGTQDTANSQAVAHEESNSTTAENSVGTEAVPVRGAAEAVTPTAMIPESESSTAPVNISGSYLACYVQTKATDAKPNGRDACRLENSSGSRVTVESIAELAIFSFKPMDSTATVVLRLAAAKTEAYDFYLEYSAATAAEIEAARNAIILEAIFKNLKSGQSAGIVTASLPSASKPPVRPAASTPTISAVGNTGSLSIQLKWSGINFPADGGGILVMRQMSAAPESIPVNGVTYSIGSNAGGCSVAFVGPSSDGFLDNYQLQPGYSYHYTVFTFTKDHIYTVVNVNASASI